MPEFEDLKKSDTPPPPGGLEAETAVDPTWLTLDQRSESLHETFKDQLYPVNVTEPTFQRGQLIVTTEDIPLGESVVPAGSFGTIVEVTTIADKPDCGTHVGAYINGWGKVTAAPYKFALEIAVEGTDTAAKSPELIEIETARKVQKEVEDLNKVIRHMDSVISELSADNEFLSSQLKEAQEHTAPLPTVTQWEIVPLWDMKAEQFKRAETEQWEFLEIKLDSQTAQVHALIRRPVQSNGTPKPTMNAGAETVYNATFSATKANDERVVVGVIETPVAVLNADAVQETVATEAAVKDMTQVYKPGKQKPTNGLMYQGEFRPTTGVKIREGK